MGHDPELAAKSLAELAATTDRALADDIRTALEAVFAAWETWRTDPAYPRTGTPQGHLMSTLATRIAVTTNTLRTLPPDAPLPAVVTIAEPILGAAWPYTPEPAAAVAAAVDRLRWAAIINVGLVRSARAIIRG